MSDLSPEMRAAIRAEVEKGLRGFGSLFSVGAPASPALATPTGFGLVQVEMTEGAPTALNSSSLVRKARPADVSNNTAAFVSAGLAVPVRANQSWILRGCLYIGSAAAATGGVQLRIVGPAVAASRLGVFGPRPAGAFQQTVSNPASATSGTFCNFDCSAAEGLVFIEANFENIAADGTLDLQFLNATGVENWIIRRTSWLLGIRTA